MDGLARTAKACEGFRRIGARAMLSASAVFLATAGQAHGGDWVEEGRLTDETFTVVSLDGDRLLVTDTIADTIVEGPTHLATVRVFERPTGEWSEVAAFRPFRFGLGNALSLDGDRALVGHKERGAAYVFERQGHDRWVQAEILSADIEDDEGPGGADERFFINRGGRHATTSENR